MESDPPFDPKVWARLGSELGVLGLAVPESDGGAGGTLVDQAIAVEELGAALACGPLFGTVYLAIPALVAASPDERRCRRRWSTAPAPRRSPSVTWPVSSTPQRSPSTPYRQKSTIYFGDTARVPYGPKSPDTVRRYSLEILHWLVGQGVKLVVVACNTSTAHALEALAKRISGTRHRGDRTGCHRGRFRHSRRPDRRDRDCRDTIASNAYAKAIHALEPVRGLEGRRPGLSRPLVEEGGFEHRPPSSSPSETASLRDGGVDALVLGCTHYPLLKPLLGRVMGPGVNLIRQRRGDRAGRGVGTGSGTSWPCRPVLVSHRFVVSDDEARFRLVGSRFIGERLGKAEVVSLG